LNEKGTLRNEWAPKNLYVKRKVKKRAPSRYTLGRHINQKTGSLKSERDVRPGIRSKERERLDSRKPLWGVNRPHLNTRSYSQKAPRKWQAKPGQKRKKRKMFNGRGGMPRKSTIRDGKKGETPDGQRFRKRKKES